MFFENKRNPSQIFINIFATSTKQVYISFKNEWPSGRSLLQYAAAFSPEMPLKGAVGWQRMDSSKLKISFHLSHSYLLLHQKGGSVYLQNSNGPAPFAADTSRFCLK